jgi:hypothetical protein
VLDHLRDSGAEVAPGGSEMGPEPDERADPYGEGEELVELETVA